MCKISELKSFQLPCTVSIFPFSVLIIRYIPSGSLPVSPSHRVLSERAGTSSGLLVHSAVLLSGPPAVSARVSGWRPHLLADRLRHPAGDHRDPAVHLHLLTGSQTTGCCHHPPVIWQPDRPLQCQLHGLQRHHSEKQPGP